MAEVPSISVKDANGVTRDVATLTALVALLGDLTATPPANTMLERLMAIKGSTDDVKSSTDDVKASTDALTALMDSVLGEVAASPTANTLLDRVKTLATLIGEVQANPTANTLLARIKGVGASIDAGNTLLTAQAAMLDGVESLLTAIGVSLDAANTRAVAALGSMTVAQSPAVNIATDQPAIQVDQKTTAHDVAVTLTRPANVTAYSANDVVGQTTNAVLTFAAMGKSGGSILITRAELELDISAIPTGMTSFRLYLYSSSPPSSLADNAAFTWSGTDRAPFLGYIDLGAPVLIGGTLYCDVTGINKQMKLSTADISAYLVTAGGYTPAANSEVYKITLHSVDV